MSRSKPSKRLIAFTHGLEDPASRFRIGQYVPHLEKAGWSVSLRTNHPARPWDSPYHMPAVRWLHRRLRLRLRRLWRLWDIRAAAAYDAVFLNRDLLAAQTAYEERLLRYNPRLIFDFDDAIFLGNKAVHAGWVSRRAALVTAGNEYLAAFARRFTDRVTVLPTVVDTGQYGILPPSGHTGPVRVGWLGSDGSIRETLFPYTEMLGRLQRRLGFDFVIISRPKPNVPAGAGLRWSFIEWSPSVETQIARHFDIGIMPLIDDEFQRGKCGCKLLQYMAAALPAIASPVGINTRLIEDGKRGFLAGTENEWSAGLSRLIRDANLRRTLGAAGREFVEDEYSLRRWFPVLLDLLERVAAGGPGTTA